MAGKLFSFSGVLGRRDYITIALVGVLVKHIIDLAIAGFVFHRSWWLMSYLVPLGVPVNLNALSPSERVFLVSMVAVALPFAWVGAAITVKRFRTIGWPNWLWILFFVPVANIASFALAAAWPEQSQHDEKLPPPRWLERIVPVDTLGAAMSAVVASSLVGVALVALGTLVLKIYGWGLFAAIPFSQGALAAFLYGVHRRRSMRESLYIAMFTAFLTFGILLAVALEGAICIIMAVPLAVGLTLIGALFGHALQDRWPDVRIDAATLLVLVLVSPAIMGVEAGAPRQAPVHVIRSQIIINASPMRVWRRVIRFPDLPPPKELAFRLGVAYPERARIVGSGVGAVRYCEFSTGSFVEPITDWQPGKKLAFRVTHNPEPMHELSPYPGLETPHLHGYMTSLRGEFRLEALSGGRTRLIGTTWYRHHLWPDPYWTIYADAIVHDIHMRVLRHIKQLAESK